MFRGFIGGALTYYLIDTHIFDEKGKMKETIKALENQTNNLYFENRTLTNKLKHQIIPISTPELLIGYKGFNKGMFAKYGQNFKYDGSEFAMNPDDLQTGACGMHFYGFPLFVTQLYDQDDDVYAEIEAGGRIVHNNDGKSVCSHMKIKRFLTKKEMIQLSTGKVITDGVTKYYKEGKYHRINGPAIEYPNGKKEFYLDGIQYDEPTHIKKVAQLNRFCWFW